MLFETSDNIKINYELTGEGETIVLANGSGVYQKIWSAQVPLLNNLGYQIPTYDHRNMEKSQRTERGHSIVRLTQDLEELISFLKIKQAIFMGHLAGVSVIFCLIKRWPTTVKRALVIDQSPKMLNDKNWKYGFMDYTSENYHRKCQERPHVHETFAGLDDDAHTKLMKTKEENPLNRKDNVDLSENHMSLDWRKAIENATIPITLFIAKESPYYREGYEKLLGEKNDQVDSLTMSPTGHVIMIKIPKQSNNKLKDILGQ